MATEEQIRVRLTGRRALAEGVVGLTLEPMDPAVRLPSWAPGAHIDMLPEGGRERQYSLCGAPGEGRWEVAVLRVLDGGGTSAWIHEELWPGEEIMVRGPRNHFVLEPAEEYQFIAGGIGITPILPMIRAAETGGARWRLAYGGRRRSSMAFLDDLACYGDKVTVFPEDETGILDLEGILGEPVPERLVYCCGPGPLLAAVETAMAGRPQERLRVERFAPKVPVDQAGGAFEVEAASTGKRVTVGEGESIIDALAAIGVRVDFSCREGTCGTCETAVLGGVPDHRDSVLSAEERAANDCMMICVGRCLRGPLILDL